MGQFAEILEKEMLESLHTRKALTVVLLCGLVIPLSLFVHQTTVRHRLVQQRQAAEQHERELELSAARYAELGGRLPADELEVRVVSPVPRLAALAAGLEERVPDVVTFGIQGLAVESTAPESLSLDLLGRIDLLFLVQFVLSLVAVAVSFHLVCDERERGTLQLLVIHGADRSKVLLGKVAGAFLLLTLPLAMGVALGLGLLAVTGSFLPAGAELARIGLLYGLALLYLGFFVLLGAWVSAVTQRCLTSLTVLLFLWITVTAVLPQTAGLVAEAVRPVPGSARLLQSKVELAHMLAAEQREELRPLVGRQDYEARRRQIADRYERRYRDLAARLDRQLEAQLADQTRTASWLAAVSPAAALSFAWTELAGTGPEHVRHFYTQVAAYQAELQETVYGGTYRDLFGGGVARGRIELVDPEDVPRFSFRPLGLGDTWRRIWPHVLLLGLLDLGAAAGAWAAFRHTEIG